MISPQFCNTTSLDLKKYSLSTPTVMGRLNHRVKFKFLQLWEECLDAGIAFGKVLRRLREESGLTQEQFGFEADLRRTYVSILELGQQQPSLTTILKIALALNISAGELVDMVSEEISK
jgi:DNA-binding XRE family transcriptional regulator